ncbi:MAG: cupin domain-containing protein [Candidatus Bathyarchaeia archaeon]|jgi:beta-alanine degradation protein BauB
MKTQMDLDPVSVASNVYNFINENEKVRVLKVVFKPGDTAKMHHHPEHVVYVLKGGKLKITSEGKTDTMDLTEGKAVFMTAQNHEATNVGDSVIDLLVIELKK